MPDESSEVAVVRFVSSRRAAREAALAALYAIWIGQASTTQALEDVYERAQYSPEAKTFIIRLVTGAVAYQTELDRRIEAYLARNWTIDRIAVTDLLVLRIATFELMKEPLMPPKVTINEAVTMAKKFGSPESGKFVNGLLGKLLLSTPKKSWKPPEVPEVVPIEMAADVDEEETVDDGSNEPEVIVTAGTDEFDELAPQLRWSLKQEPRS
ncbi:MAG: transcription antitermination factor NusB [Armatimonadetes bacterium]|nr:transcription antitermination factor NusB [Armatimonadota bacterium]